MGLSGVFITLYDEEALTLYIREGVYGFLMAPVFGAVSSRSFHYHALADYACTRNETHVFFFLKRKIYYGGQVSGSSDYAAFDLNGLTSPLGREANAPLCWDESSRYIPTAIPGVFNRLEDENEKSQPYLIRFKDLRGYSDRYISSDQLYFELGKYGYPLPSNSIQGMSFCTLSPGEVRLLLSLFENDAEKYNLRMVLKPTTLVSTPIAFNPVLGVQSLREAFHNLELVNEAHLEFSILANPNLLPAELRPNAKDVICRQIPISPFKPFNMDRADISYYSSNEICEGTIPNVLIELKNQQAGQQAVNQVIRYLDWLFKIVERETVSQIQTFILAPAFAPRVQVPKYKNQIELVVPDN